MPNQQPPQKPPKTPPREMTPREEMLEILEEWMADLESFVANGDLTARDDLYLASQVKALLSPTPSHYN